MDSTEHVRRARDGDAASVAWIVDRFTPALVAQARHRLRGPLGRAVEPDDLVAEVWAVALSALSALTADGPRRTPALLKFLSTTLVYRLNHHARRFARHAPRDSAAVDALPAATRGAVTRAIGGEAGRLVAQAIDALPEKDRAVVVLRAIEQRSNAEVAQLVGDSPNAVSLRYNRALRTLADQLPDSLFGELA